MERHKAQSTENKLAIRRPFLWEQKSVEALEGKKNA